MTPAQTVLSEACKRLARETLRPAGFAGSGRRFTRKGPSFTALIELQLSQSSTPSNLSFVVNYGLVVPALIRASGASVPTSLTYTACHWGGRPRDPLDGAERWLTVRDADDPVQVASDLSTLMRVDVLPALEAVGDPHALCALWRRGVSPGLSAGQRLFLLPLLLLELGDRAAADAEIAALRSREGPDAEFALRRLAQSALLRPEVG